MKIATPATLRQGVDGKEVGGEERHIVFLGAGIGAQLPQSFCQVFRGVDVVGGEFIDGVIGTAPDQQTAEEHGRQAQKVKQEAIEEAAANERDGRMVQLKGATGKKCGSCQGGGQTHADGVEAFDLGHFKGEKSSDFFFF